MRDPHVSWLEYELKTAWQFDNPPPLTWKTPLFEANLSEGILRVELLDHFAAIQNARTAVEPFLQSWEIDLALNYGQRPMTFQFKSGDLIDRNPPLPGSEITGAGSAAFTFSSSGMVHQAPLKTYPAVPVNFVATPDVITLWNRFEGFKKGQEPLAAMAYFCFTLLKNRFAGSPSTALQISAPVFKTLSELSTNRGDNLNARKVTASLRAFNTIEAQWLEAAILALIRRVGEVAAGHSSRQLTMDDLPKL